jgi:Phosphofructokinase
MPNTNPVHFTLTTWGLSRRGPVQIDRCFGFDTAVEEAQRALLGAKVEASSAYKGIGLVKLMGRQSGFIALQVEPQNLRH